MNRIGRWDTWEFTLKSRSSYDNPFRDVTLTADFTHRKSGKVVRVTGFHDGGRMWRIRFMPTERGTWSYRTTSNDKELDNVEGKLTCVVLKANHLRSPITCRGHAFVHADGSVRFVISTRLSCHLEKPQTWPVQHRAYYAPTTNYDDVRWFDRE